MANRCKRDLLHVLHTNGDTEPSKGIEMVSIAFDGAWCKLPYLDFDKKFLDSLLDFHKKQPPPYITAEVVMHIAVEALYITTDWLHETAETLDI